MLEENVDSVDRTAKTTTCGLDADDPRVTEINPATGMQNCYVILTDEERAKGFVRPVRTKYIHTKCGAVTWMGPKLAETYARSPTFYTATFCASCRGHFPVGPNGEFVWDGTDVKVGT